MHDSKLIFVRAATFGQLTEQIFHHERSSKLEKPVTAWRLLFRTGKPRSSSNVPIARSPQTTRPSGSSSKSTGDAINVVQGVGQIRAESQTPAQEILSRL